MTRSHRTAGWLVIPLAVLFVAGCASMRTTETGTPFVEVPGEARAALDTLARRILAEARTIQDAVPLIQGRAWTNWSATYQRVVQASAEITALEKYQWRYAYVRKGALSLGVLDLDKIETRGYVLAVHVANGMIVGAAADVTRLTARERTWLTHRLASVGAAAVGTLILLQTD